MKQYLFLLFFLFVLTVGAFCQQQFKYEPDKMALLKPLRKPSIIYKEKIYIGSRQMKELFADEGTPEQISYLNRYSTNNTLAGIFGFIGGFGVGYGGVLVISGDKDGWPWLGGGAVVTLLAGLLQGSANKNLQIAVTTFNEDKSKKTSKVVLNAGLTTNGAGVQLRF
ncbi:MAG: hypothetical protein SFU87_21770 [Chitinophagaceae bacterium]|nr:hypothetical protein [Chitinophagaceae bacterium]